MGSVLVGVSYAQDRTVFYFVSLDLRVVRIQKWLHKCIPVLLMFGDVMSKGHEDGLIKSLGLVFLLWMIRCCCQ